MIKEMKREGDNIILTVSQNTSVDTDKDNQTAMTAAITLQVTLDGSEVLSELLKSSNLAEKAKTILAKVWPSKG